MAIQIRDNKCVVCDSTPLALEPMAPNAEAYAHCQTCGTFYSRMHNDELLDQWHAPYKSSALLLLREFWHMKHSKIPSLYAAQPQPRGVGVFERKLWDEFMSQRQEELLRLGNESIDEHRETLRRLA